MQRQSLMLRTIDDFFRQSGIHVGVLEKPQTEFRSQNARHGAIHQRNGNNARFHLLQQRAVHRAIGEVVVHARRKRFASRLRFICGNLVNLEQHLQSISVRCHIPAKTPFLAENGIQQPRIDMRRDAVDFVVGRHHASRACFLHSRLKRHKKSFAQDTL